LIKNDFASIPPVRLSPSQSNRVAALLAFGCLLLVSWGVVTAAPGVAQSVPQDVVDVRVNQTTTADQHEPTLAVDPTNPNNVLAASKDWRTGPKQVWHYRSTDGGRTWRDG